MMKITQSRDFDSRDHMHKSIWRGTIIRVFAVLALQANALRIPLIIRPRATTTAGFRRNQSATGTKFSLEPL
jgi:hypothetical protein